MGRSIARFRALAVATLVLTGSLTTPAVALAQSSTQTAAAKSIVDAAKAANQVGEQADGFLGLVSNATADVRGAVAEINAGRAEAYRAIASKTGVSPDAAGQATARELIARLPPGASYKAVGGDWRRK